MEGKWPDTIHRWSVTLTDSKGRKCNPTRREITSALDGARPVPRGALLPRAVLTQSVLLAGNAALALPPPLPTASSVPTARAGGSSLPTNTPGRQSRRAAPSNTASAAFSFLQKFMERLCCWFFLLPLPWQSLSVSSLYVLRRLAALGLEGLLLAFRTFSVTLLRFLLSDPSLDPGSDEVFSFSLLLGFSAVFPKLPEGAKTETGPE